MKYQLADGIINYEVRSNERPFLILHGSYLDHRHRVDVKVLSITESSNWKRIYPDFSGHGQTTLADSFQNHDQVLDVLSEFTASICLGETYAVAGELRGVFLPRGLVVKEPPELITAMLKNWLNRVWSMRISNYSPDKCMKSEKVVTTPVLGCSCEALIVRFSNQKTTLVSIQKLINVGQFI